MTNDNMTLDDTEAEGEKMMTERIKYYREIDERVQREEDKNKEEDALLGSLRCGRST